MKICAGLTVFLTSVFFIDDCTAINATVTPSPFWVAVEGENVTLSCKVNQWHKSDTALVLRWIFHPVSGGDEQLLAKVNMRRAKFYGNYTKSFPKPKIKLIVVKQGKIYNLLIINITRDDIGLYSCRVHEFKKHRERWKSSANSTAATELKVSTNAKGGLWSLFEGCQYLQKKRHLKESYHLVKSPQNSSGETVTSVVSLSPALPKKQKNYKTKRKVQQVEDPPEIPAKAPIADRLRKPKLLKPQTRKIILPKITEESLTYAELELVKPLPDAKTSKTGTVYAQILFEDQMV
ncbi:V-set and transmembrane domain-containing protein 4 isoform X3 [Tachysurus vachellii]|uniref:V-set and transmembrane domain-containing protein 4 isoform X3 n=1 Tax=Tachysurus vachellii TaxID=175792 RepID=UPI00296B243C|nr:V-set and transmembrane domain-containing protein 4 isoform X3 [Tachysurus vachellii]